MSVLSQVSIACTGWEKTLVHWHIKKNIVGINVLIGRLGTYIQGKAEIYFGNYVQLASNVRMLSSNHDLYDQRKGYNL